MLILSVIGFLVIREAMNRAYEGEENYEYIERYIP